MATYQHKITKVIYRTTQDLVTHQQTTTTELQAPDLGQAQTYRMWRC